MQEANHVTFKLLTRKKTSHFGKHYISGIKIDQNHSGAFWLTVLVPANEATDFVARYCADLEILGYDSDDPKYKSDTIN